jgi:hypothetical protein
VANLRQTMLLVGDNPFHRISHLSQDRARIRSTNAEQPSHAAELVMLAVENGANGFILSILKEMRQRGETQLNLYAIVPYAYEYVRIATQVGGVTGLMAKMAKEIAKSKSVGTIAMGLGAAIRSNPVSIMKTYLSYEISRIRSAAGKKANLSSVLLHQVVTDMALALNLDWLFRSYIAFMLKHKLTPGFNTGNFTYLVEKFRSWNLDLDKIVLAAPFNKVGFQMIPSKGACEKALESLAQPIVLAISILAAGYVKPPEAIDYIAGLPNLKGVAIGVSKASHARETFSLFHEKLNS